MSQLTGFQPWPPRCPACRARIRDVALHPHAGVVRCHREACRALAYVIPAPGAGLAYLAAITPEQLHAIRQQQMSPQGVVVYLNLHLDPAA